MYVIHGFARDERFVKLALASYVARSPGHSQLSMLHVNVHATLKAGSGLGTRLLAMYTSPWGTYKTRNEEMGNKKWGNEEMRKWNGNGRQACWDEVAL